MEYAIHNFRLVMTRIFSVTLVGACLSLGGCFSSKKKFAEVLQGQISNASLQDFELDSQVEDHWHTLSRFSKKDQILFVEEGPMNNEAPQGFVEIREAQINDFYAAATAPYPSQLTNVVKCDPKYLPKKIRHRDAKMVAVAFALYANDRFSYGACASYQVKYRVTEIIVGCKKNWQLFSFKLFSPISDISVDLESKIAEFKCATEEIHGSKYGSGPPRNWEERFK